MKKEALLKRLLIERGYFEALLNQFPQEIWERPLLAADWSLRDLLYHISWYEEQTAIYLETKKLIGSPWWEESLDERNEKILRAGRKLDAATVRLEAIAIFKRLVRIIEQMPQELLDDPSYIEGMPADWRPWEGVRQNGYEHYGQHSADLVAAFEQWEASSATVQQFQLDEVKVSIITTGHLRADLAEWWQLEVKEMGCFSSFLRRPFRLPMQAILIETAETKILVDIPVYDLTRDSPYYLPNYQPPEDCLTQLKGLGITADQIEYLVFTHFHFDHINGAVIEKDGKLSALFPKAVHYLGRADWESAAVQEGLRDEQSVESRVLGHLYAQGQLQLVEERITIVPGVELIVTGGESLGHQIVCLRTAQHRLYCLGDLFHHIAESYQADLMSSWVDEKQTAINRASMIEEGNEEGGLLVCAHIRGVGQIGETAVGPAIVMQ